MATCFTQVCSAALLAFSFALSGNAPAQAQGVKPMPVSAPVVTTAPNAAGVIVQPSGYDMAGTIARLKADIAAKGIPFFSEIDQADLATKAGVAGVRPSVLLVFGNPPLGTQFLSANAQAGLDWPVRMLVYADAAGAVQVAWTDFAWIARRHGIESRADQFKKASEVAASIASAAAAQR